MTQDVLSRVLLLPGAARRYRAAVTVAAVAAVAGLMFAASAQLAHGEDAVRHPTDLAELVSSESERVDHLAAKVDALQAEVDDLSSKAPAGAAAQDPALAQREAVAVGSVPVTGPGLRVALDDAPASSTTIPGVSADELVVHQQDLQDVINALWAGGAEAMTLQGQRVSMTSAFRCSGNILLLHGQVFSPPYVVEAVGDPTALQAALDASEGVQTYLWYVSSLGLGWDVQASDDLRLPAFAGSTALEHATLPAGTDPLG